MKAIAYVKSIRLSAFKARKTASLINGKSIGEALKILDFTNQKATLYIKKVINSAVSNAVNNFNLNANELIISEIIINEGPTLKRFLPRAKGKADNIFKRTCHIKVVVDDQKKVGK